jgi:hypothetical protein
MNDGKPEYIIVCYFLDKSVIFRFCQGIRWIKHYSTTILRSACFEDLEAFTSQLRLLLPLGPNCPLYQ